MPFLSNKSKDPCKLNACKIQSCLTKNNYQESSCLEVLEEMRQCCLKYHDRSLCCSGIKLDKPYVETSNSKIFLSIMENHQRRMTSVKRNWIQRNPRIFSTIFITSSLMIFFSRPIYDAFIRDDLVPSPNGKAKPF